MEPTETPSADFVKGFNEGYVLSQHAPHIAASLDQLDSSSDRLSGLQAGRGQYLAEQNRERLPSWLKGSSGREQRGQEPERDLEPDR
jgi:hypothetical protein